MVRCDHPLGHLKERERLLGQIQLFRPFHRVLSKSMRCKIRLESSFTDKYSCKLQFACCSSKWCIVCCCIVFPCTTCCCFQKPLYNTLINSLFTFMVIWNYFEMICFPITPLCALVNNVFTRYSPCRFAVSSLRPTLPADLS